MSIGGYTFDLAQVPAAKDGSLYDWLNFGRDLVIPNRLNNCTVSTSGLSITVATGQILYQGRFIEISAPETVNVSASSSGNLVVTIDLTQTNTSSGTPGTDYVWTNAQVSVQSVSTVSTSDLNNGGLISSFLLGTWTSTTSSVTFARNNSAYSTLITFAQGTFAMENDSNTQTNINYNAGFSAANSGAPGNTFTVRRNGIVFLTIGFNSANALPSGTYQIGTISNPNHYPWQTTACSVTSSSTGSIGQFDAYIYVSTSGIITLRVFAPSSGGAPANVNFFGGCGWISSTY